MVDKLPNKKEAKAVLKETRRAGDDSEEPTESELYNREYRRQGRVPSDTRKTPE